MINIIRNTGACVFALVCVMLCVACATDKNVYQHIDYTDDALVSYEVDSIIKLAETDCLKALWRSQILRDNTADTGSVADYTRSTYESMLSKVLAAFEAAIKHESYAEALRIYVSLDSLQEGARLESYDVSLVNLKEKQRNRLFAQARTADAEGGAVAGTTEKSFITPYTAVPPSSDLKVSQMIRGTATIWVDRGIKVANGRGYAERIIGSGFFIDERGYLITNYHVIASEVDPTYEGYSRLYIKMADDPDTRIPARVVGWDPIFDLALIKVEVTPPYVFPLGSSRDLDVGDTVYAIGSPIGLDRTLTSGIVSMINRRLFSLGGVLQIDAAVNQGNSGGPLIDKNGTVQAVVFAGVESYQGLNFAVPVEYLRLLLDDLYEGGMVQHGWFGAYGKTIKTAAGNEGVEVLYVLPGGSADRSGVRVADRIRGINGMLIESLEQLQDSMLSYPVGSIVRLNTIRDFDTEKEQSRECFLYIEERPQNPGYEIYTYDIPERAFVPIFGMGLTELTAGKGKKYVITSIVKGGVADESGFSIQDSIEVLKKRLSPELDALYLEIYTKKQKNGFLDDFVGIGAALDSPYYF